MANTDARKILLEQLIKFEAPLGALKEAISVLAWEDEGFFVTLTKKEICTMLRRYMDDQVSDLDLQLWGELIESREEIIFEEPLKDSIKNFIFEISNPEINGAFNHARALEWKHCFGCQE